MHSEGNKRKSIRRRSSFTLSISKPSTVNDEYSKKADEETRKWNETLQNLEHKLCILKSIQQSAVIVNPSKTDEQFNQRTETLKNYLRVVKDFTYAYEDYMNLMKRQTEINDLHYEIDKRVIADELVKKYY